MYDVFISYRRDGGFEMARLLYEHLRLAGLNPFFDLEELRSGQFNEKLYNAIDDSENFLLVLPQNALDRCNEDGDWLRLEIEHAIEKNKNIVPLMMTGFDWPKDLPSSMKNLPVYNAVHMSREYFDASIDRLISMMNGVSIQNGTVVRASQRADRRENPYFAGFDEKEAKRLEIQQKLIKDFDAECYKRIDARYDSLRVLDVGCNDGAFIFDRLGWSTKIDKIVGLELNEDSVKAANAEYGGDKAAFYTVNVESDEFVERLEKIMRGSGIDDFNVINLSMILLHIKTPYKLLKALRQFLAPDGVIVVKDIDDGFNVAYPDENGDFARVMEICLRNETSGFRHSGRQIYTLLRRAGYRGIKLEKLGLTTVGMDCEKREAFFETYFSFVLSDLKIMKERYPLDKRIQGDYKWFKDIYDELEEKFMEENLFFSLGFILYTAGKK